MATKVYHDSRLITDSPITKLEYVVCHGRILSKVNRLAIPRGHSAKLHVVARAMEQYIQSDVFVKLSLEQRLQVFENADFLNRKIEKHNVSFGLCRRFIDLALYILSFGYYRLKIESIDICKMSDRMIASVDPSGRMIRDLFIKRFHCLIKSRVLALFAQKVLSGGITKSEKPVKQQLISLRTVYRLSAEIRFASAVEAEAKDDLDRIFALAKYYFLEDGGRSLYELKRHWELAARITPLCTPQALEILLLPIPIYDATWTQQLRDRLKLSPSIGDAPADLQSIILDYETPSTNLLELLSSAALMTFKRVLGSDGVRTHSIIHELNDLDEGIATLNLSYADKERFYVSLYFPYHRSSEHRDKFLQDSEFRGLDIKCLKESLLAFVPVETFTEKELKMLNEGLAPAASRPRLQRYMTL